MEPVEVETLSRPILQNLHNYWLERRRDGRLPSRADVDPIDLPSLLPYIILVDVLHDPLDFRYRLIGTKTVEVMGRDGTGKKFGELGYGEENLATLRRFYGLCAEERRPVFTRGSFLWADTVEKNWLDYELVRLPLADRQGRVDMLLCAIEFWSKAEGGCKD